MPWDSNDATLIHTQGIYILYTLKVSCMLMIIVGGHLKGTATVQVVPFDAWVHPCTLGYIRAPAVV